MRSNKQGQISAYRFGAETLGLHVERAPNRRSQIWTWVISMAVIAQTSPWRMHLRIILKSIPRGRELMQIKPFKLVVVAPFRESTPWPSFQVSDGFMVQTQMMKKADGHGRSVRSHLLRPTFRRSASTKHIFQHPGQPTASAGSARRDPTARRPTRRDGIHPCQEGYQVAVFPEACGRQAAMMVMTLMQCQRTGVTTVMRRRCTMLTRKMMGALRLGRPRLLSALDRVFTNRATCGCATLNRKVSLT